MENKNEKIIKKIKGLLAISRDERNDEESQSAFVLAQRLMIQYSIDKSLVEDSEYYENEGLVMSKYKVIAILEESINYDSVTAKIKNVTNNKLFEGYIFDLLDEIDREVSSKHELYIIDIVDINKRSLINSVVTT